MKKIILIILIISTFLFSKEVITASMPSNFPPYYIVDEKNKPTGFAVEILNEVAKLSNLEVKYIITKNFVEAEKLFLNKQVDVMPNSGITKQREQNSIFTIPTDTFVISAFKRVNEFDLKNLDDIKDKKVVVVNGNIGKRLMSNHPENELIFVNSNKEAILDLLSANADILVYPKIATLKLLKELNIEDKIVPLDEPLKEIIRAIRINKDNPQLAKKLNKSLEEFLKTDKYNEIYTKWFKVEELIEFEKQDVITATILTVGLIILLIVIIAMYISSNKLRKDLEVSKKQFENMFRNHETVMLLIDPVDGKIVDANNSAIKFYEYSLQEFLSMNISQINILTKEEIEERINLALKKNINTFIFEHKLKNGIIKHVEVNSTPIQSDNKTFLFSIIKDKTKEFELETEQKSLLSLFDIGDSVLFKWNKDEDWSIDYVSSNVERLLGYNKEEFLNKQVLYSNCIHNEDLARVFEEVENGKKLNENFFKHKPYRVLTKDNEVKWVLDYTVLDKDKDGNILHFVGYIIDITSQMKLQTELKDSEFRWKFAIEGNKDGLWDWNVKTSEVFFSKQWKEMLGFNEVEIKASLEEWEKRVHPDDLKDVYKDINDYFEGKTEVYDNQHRVLHKDGHYIWVRDRGTIVQRDNQGNVERIIGTHTDITKIKEYEKAILHKNKELETIFDYSGDGIAILDLNSKFINFNKAYLEMTEYEHDELLQKSCIELTAKEDIEKAQNALKELIEKGSLLNFEKTCISKYGKRINVNMSLSLLPNKKEILLVTKNMNTLKLLEHQAKLASMGEMIGNIAHQWRQPLNNISLNASTIKFLIEENIDNIPKEDLVNYSDKIVHYSKYLSDTIDNFRNFIKDDNSYGEVKVIDIINNAIYLVQDSLKNNYIEFKINGETNSKVLGSKNELTEAFINILNNSKDVLKEKVKDNRIINIDIEENEKTIDIKICDNAGGIDKSIIKNIFDPYFTTKHKSQGTGLGLSIVDKIVREKHKGSVIAYNEEFTFNDKTYFGACFKITLLKKDSFDLIH